MDELEIFLANWFRAEYCLTFGRASAGLYALFKALADKEPEGEVLIPELCCETIPIAASFAGLRPVMIDVDPDTLGPSLSDVTAKLGPKTRALLLIYLFGIPFEIEPFLALKEDHDFVLIEDIAQAVGGVFSGQRLGCRGDAAVLSFDDRKILRGAGGTVVLRASSPLTAKIRAVRREIDARSSPAGIEQLKASFRNLIHALADLLRSNPEAGVASVFRSLTPYYEPIIVLPRAGLESGPIVAQMERIEEDRARRFGRYIRYREGLRDTEYRVLDYPEGAMCWRVPVVARDMDTALAAAARLLSHGLPASNHYFPFGQFIDGKSAPTAGRLGRRLLNLWVDDAVSDLDIDRTLELLMDV